jgi:hypothetical protein
MLRQPHAIRLRSGVYSVNYPIVEARRLASAEGHGDAIRECCLWLSMPVDSGSHTSPNPVCIGRLIDCLSGAVQPVNVPEASTILYPGFRAESGACLSLSPVLGTKLADIPRDSYSIAPKKGGGHSSPRLRAGISWPRFR